VCDDPPVPDFDAYLARLGVARREPSLDALFELQRAHVERIPYETLWIARGDARSIDPAESIAAILRGHGGYCFQLNGALSALLAWLGYDVTLHAGSVHGSDGPSSEQLHNHLVLLVHHFPTDANPTGTWHVDAGLGDGLHEPIPLLAGTYAQAGLTFTLAPSPHPDYDWHWQHDPRGAFAGMSFQRAETTLAHFEPMHERLSTSPDSVFVNNLILMRRDATGSAGIANLLLTETDASGARRRVIEDRDEWHDLVRHRFLRSTSDASATEIDRIWAMLMARLEAFRAAHPSAAPVRDDAAAV
jgi:N-hydroxyarylamine O-acetyltransferase